MQKDVAMDSKSQEMFNMKYFDLLGLKQGQYFNRFLRYFNSHYDSSAQLREYNYGRLIQRYYRVDQGGMNYQGADANYVAGLIDDNTHMANIYNSLQEFGYGKRGSESVSYSDFEASIRSHKNVITGLAGWTMDSITPNAVPQSLLDDLGLLYHELEVVPEGKPKLVWISKTLHFLLPSLVMPVDGEIVLSFLGEKMPQNEAKRFDLFKEIFHKYIGLAAHLGLKLDNGDGNWWNISVPKRIDNSIEGFWKIFNKGNRERIICGHIDVLLNYLNIP